MANSTAESRRERRLRKKACAELAIINGCLARIEAQSDRADRNCEVIKQKLVTVSQELASLRSAGASHATVTRSLVKARCYKSELEKEESLNERYANLLEMFSELCSDIERLIDAGEYLFVIRTIPEKKIPRYLKRITSEGMESLRAIILSLINEINDANFKVVKSAKAFREENAKAGEVFGIMTEGYRASENEVDAEISAFVSEYAPASAVPAMPMENQTADAQAKRSVNRA